MCVTKWDAGISLSCPCWSLAFWLSPSQVYKTVIAHLFPNPLYPAGASVTWLWGSKREFSVFHPQFSLLQIINKITGTSITFERQYSCPLNNARVGVSNPVQSKIHMSLYSQPSVTMNHVILRHIFTGKKICIYKWTHAVQSHVVQGSTT